MTREEYLNILQANLQYLPPQEAENIMEYYLSLIHISEPTRPY